MNVVVKTICVDARMINNSGIGVYIRHFVQTLINQGTYAITLLGRKRELDIHFKDLSYCHVEADFPIYSIQEQYKLPALIPDCDLFWSPHYNVPILPIKVRKLLVTIPDVYHLAFYDTLTLSQKLYAKIVLNAAAFKADQLTTISLFSKKQIEEFISVKSAEIVVTHLGIDFDLFRDYADNALCDKVAANYSLPPKFILFVGNVKPNKNLKTLVAAFARISSQLTDHQIVIVGKRDGFINGDPSLFEEIDSNPAIGERVRFTGYVALADLPIIYSMASVFAFPSLYEGFGFPPLEAMACGTPVVASNRASIPEICGDAVVYADPDDIQAFADALYRVCTDSQLRDRLIKNGLDYVKQFTWQKAGREFLQVVDKLLLK
jgi:glycosyltransferase involved in cell wall biosynthesis